MSHFSKIDDDFYAFLTEDVPLIGDAEIPMLMDLRNASVPKGLVPFEKIAKDTDRHKYVHFYVYDNKFIDLIPHIDRYVNLFLLRDGVITPDYSLISNRSRSIQQMHTFFNRAVGCYLQKKGVPVIPNIRWCDERSYDFCFLGVPRNSIVAISTHGCLRTKEEQQYFRKGLNEMLNRLEPEHVVVHGRMPEKVFGDVLEKSHFHRYPSLIEEVHSKEVSGGC